MRERRITRPSRTIAAALSAAGALLTIAVVYLIAGHQPARLSSERYTLADVRRTDLHPALTASGRVESSKRTVIECELENIAIGVLGERLSAGGASVLLSIVPEGSVVRRGDVLAVLDSSDYEELLRQQKMTVERSRADFRQSELNLEIAKLAVREFRDGSMTEAIKDFQRSLALAESDLERVKDRLEWVRRMKDKGYVPAAQVTNEEFNFARALFGLGQQQAAFQLYTKWMAPRSLRVLENQVLAAQATYNYQRLRLNRNLERLAKLEQQVQRCTIRAPHDGFVIYANDRYRDIQIEPGMFVRQKQDLMYLPDLTDMEVVASLHESVLPEVSRGMRARVLVEGMSNRRVEGHVVRIATVPSFNWRSDVRYFDSVVKLEDPPRGILPGMSAHVEIELERREQVLAVPAEAVAHEDGREVCYVAHEDGIERREVKLGEATEELLEISAGLHEGERVVLNPNLSELQSDETVESSSLSESRLSEDGKAPAADADEPVRAVTALN